MTVLSLSQALNFGTSLIITQSITSVPSLESFKPRLTSHITFNYQYLPPVPGYTTLIPNSLHRNAGGLDNRWSSWVRSLKEAEDM